MSKIPSKQEMKKLGITKVKQIAHDNHIPGYTKYQSKDIDKLIELIHNTSKVEKTLDDNLKKFGCIIIK